MTKNLLRNEMLTTLRNIKKNEYDQLCAEINNFFITSEEFRNAEIIGLTISRFPEVNTRPIIDAIWSIGKKVVVPKCIKQTKEMDFRLITSYNDLETVYMDLQEPIVAQTKSIAKKEIDLQIVPGVLYSAEGYRVGFGGGYYDRYLKNFRGHTMSLAFNYQTGHTLPLEMHDVPVESIITEKGIYSCKKK